MVHFPKNKYPIKVDYLSRVRKGIMLHDYSGKKKYFWGVTLFIKSIIFVAQTTVLVEVLDNPKRIIEIAATYPIALLAVIKIAVILTNHDRMIYFFNTIDNDFWDYSVSTKEVELSIIYRLTFIQKIFTMHFTNVCLCILFLVFYPLVEMPEGMKQLPALVWLPFNTNPTPLYQITFFLLAYNMFVSVLGHAFYDATFIYCAQQLSVQFQILKDLIENLATDLAPDRDDVDRFKSLQFQKIIQNRINICIRHHNILLEFAAELTKFATNVMGAQLFTSCLALVIVLFSLSEDHSDIMKSGVLFTVTASLTIQLTIFCLQGSDLIEMCELVAKAAYHCDWHLMEASIRKKLKLMMMNSIESVAISASGLVTVDNNLIVLVYQRVFSCIAFLKSFGE